MKKYLMSFLLLISLSGLFSQELEHYIGAGFGITQGGGLFYRYWPGKWGIQGAMLPFFDFTEGSGNINLASTVTRTLIDGSWSRLFLYGGFHVVPGYGDYDTDEGMQKGFILEGMGIGIGPGIELFIDDHIVLDLMFGYGFSSEMGGLNFSGEAFLSYRF